MLIRDVVKVMQLPTKVIHGVQYTKREKHRSFLYEEGGQACYWMEESIQSAFRFKLYQPRREEILVELEEKFGLKESDPRRSEKFVVVYELLLAMERHMRTEITREQMVSAVNAIEEAIAGSLDFKKIPEMKELEKFIRQDSMLRELYFTVRVIPYNLDEAWKCKKKEQTVYSFGNKKHLEVLDCMDMQLLNDRDEFMYIREAKTHSYPLNEMFHSQEERIYGLLLYFLEEYPLSESIKMRQWKKYRDIVLPYTVTRSDDEYLQAIAYWRQRGITQEQKPEWRIVEREDDF